MYISKAHPCVTIRSLCQTGHFAFAKIEFTTYISVVSLRTSLTLIQPFNGCMESLIGFSLLHFYHYPLFIQHSVRKHWSLSCMNNF